MTFAAIAIATICAALARTVWGQDVLAKLAGRTLKIDKIIPALERRARDLYVFRVVTPNREETILAASQEAAANEGLMNDDETATVDCLLAPYRVVGNGDGLDVFLLPGWLAWAGRTTCPHGGVHAPPLDPSALEALLVDRGSSNDALHRTLLESEIIVVNFEIVQRADGPRARMPVMSVGGRDAIPVFTSERYLPLEPGLRISRQPFRLVLEIMKPPMAPIVVNPSTPLERVIELETFTQGIE